MSSQTPSALGYRMPAEWEPHTATWLSWPRREGISFPESFDRVLPALRAMVEALIESEQVCINVCNGAHEAEARSVLSGSPFIMSPPTSHGAATTARFFSHATSVGVGSPPSRDILCGARARRLHSRLW